jgi:hypothetical protein
MTRRIPLPQAAPGDADVPGVMDNWLDLQGELLGLSLAQIAQWQQAAWMPWIDFATAWWRLPTDVSPFSAALPFWVRGTEQLA